MWGKCPLESLHHSIRLWLECCIARVLLILHCLHISENSCAQPQRDDRLWGIYGWHWIGLDQLAAVIAHHKNSWLSVHDAINGSARSLALLSNGCLVLCLCNLPCKSVCGPLIAAHVAHLWIWSSTSSL